MRCIRCGRRLPGSLQPTGARSGRRTGKQSRFLERQHKWHRDASRQRRSMDRCGRSLGRPDYRVSLSAVGFLGRTCRQPIRVGDRIDHDRSSQQLSVFPQMEHSQIDGFSPGIGKPKERSARKYPGNQSISRMVRLTTTMDSSRFIFYECTSQSLTIRISPQQTVRILMRHVHDHLCKNNIAFIPNWYR